MRSICYFCEEEKECGMYDGNTMCRDCMAGQGLVMIVFAVLCFLGVGAFIWFLS